MKPIYKSVKVIYDAHLKMYQVWYRNWFFWHYDSGYRFDEQKDRYPVHYCLEEEAKERAINRAKAMLETVEVYRDFKFRG